MMIAQPTLQLVSVCAAISLWWGEKVTNSQSAGEDFADGQADHQIWCCVRGSQVSEPEDGAGPRILATRQFLADFVVSTKTYQVGARVQKRKFGD